MRFVVFLWFGSLIIFVWHYIVGGGCGGDGGSGSGNGGGGGSGEWGEGGGKQGGIYLPCQETIPFLIEGMHSKLKSLHG